MGLQAWLKQNFRFNEPVVCLRVDIDTIGGFSFGVPKLEKILKELDVPATFFVPTGPDNTGKNLFQILRKREWKKLRYSRIRRFGRQKKNLIFSLFLDGPDFEAQKGFTEKLLQLISSGHEIGLHGYNHELWVRTFQGLDEQAQEDMIMEGFKRIPKQIRDKIKGFASPGFKTSKHLFKVLDSLGITYVSDLNLCEEGSVNFWNNQSSIPQSPTLIPINQPLIQELYYSGSTASQIYDLYKARLKKKKSYFSRYKRVSPFIFYVHAGFEPLFFPELLRAILMFAKKKKFRILKLNELAML